MKSQTEGDWLLTEILTGLQKLALLHLANAPRGDELHLCAGAWLEVCEAQRGWHMGEREAIREAFARLMARKPAEGRPVFWPAPGDLIAAMDGDKGARPAPYHQPFAIEWDKHQPKNRSLTAKAHVTFNCARLEIPVPAWALPESDAESEAILQMVAEIKAEVRDHRRQLAERLAA